MSAPEQALKVTDTPEGNEIVRLRLLVIEMQADLDRQASTIASYQRQGRRSSRADPLEPLLRQRGAQSR